MELAWEDKNVALLGILHNPLDCLWYNDIILHDNFLMKTNIFFNLQLKTVYTFYNESSKYIMSTISKLKFNIFYKNSVFKKIVVLILQPLLESFALNSI